MKTNKKLHSVTLASVALILFLIFVSSTASAQTEPEITGGVEDTSDEQALSDEVPTEVDGIDTESIQPAALKITETQITTNESKQWHPAIYDNIIVWEDCRDGDYRHPDIYMYDLSNKKETKISTTKFTTGGHYSPAIYMNRVVWVGATNDDYFYGIYVEDLSTKKQDVIFQSTDEIGDPKIYGDNIVYSNALTSNYAPDIYMYNLSTYEGKKISTSEIAEEPDIYGNKIVWHDFNSRDEYDEDNWDIYMYDLSITKEKRIIASENETSCPTIYGNIIVWQDKRNGNWDIYMYDLSTKKETQITTNKFDQIDPDIYGNTIVWQDNRSGNWDIYAYDLKTYQQIHTTNKSDQVEPAIYGNKVLWTDDRNGNPDIYMGTLSTSSPVAAFSASPTSGTAPLKVCFTDKSTGSPTKWKWTFGDGASSTAKNPTHRYSKAGNYTVALTVTNAAGSNTITKTNYIKVTAAIPKPVASFSASPNSGKAPLTVAFTDKSTGIPTKWKWTFGDGASSTEKNPKHQYLQEGKYKVTLTVTNAAGSSTVTKTNYITVTTNTRPGIYSEGK